MSPRMTKIATCRRRWILSSKTCDASRRGSRSSTWSIHNVSIEMRHRNRVGQFSVRHMCDAGVLSKPRTSFGCLKLRPTISVKSSRLTTASGSKEQMSFNANAACGHVVLVAARALVLLLDIGLGLMARASPRDSAKKQEGFSAMFDPQLHPRIPAGHPDGGRFAFKCEDKFGTLDDDMPEIHLSALQRPVV